MQTGLCVFAQPCLLIVLDANDLLGTGKNARGDAGRYARRAWGKREEKGGVRGERRRAAGWAKMGGGALLLPGLGFSDLRLPGHQLRRAANYLSISSFLKTNRRN